MQKAKKVIPVHKITAIKIMILFSITCVSAGCGIKTYPYLAPPEDSSISQPLENEKLFTFYNYTENNTNYFLGYEVYYKFYSTDTDSSNYMSETQVIELTPKHDKLVSLGYKRMYNKADVYSKPLIPVSSELAEQAVSIEIDFRFLTENIFPSISYAENSIEAGRYVQQNGDVQENIYNFHKEAISSEYTDIPSSIYSSETENLYLSLYVLAYGKYEVFNDLYSNAAHLGKITLQTKNALF